MSNQLRAIMEAAEKGDMTEVMRLQTVKRVNDVPKWKLEQWDISEEDWESSSMSVKLTLIRLMDNCEEAHDMYNRLSEAIENLPIHCL